MTYALITGASKGIGKSLAYALAKQKVSPLLVARSENLLKELAEDIRKQHGVDAQYLSMDLSKPEAASTLKNWIAEKGFAVSILINNAGYGLWGRFDELPIQDQNNMIQLNVYSLVNLTHEILPILKQQKQSYILNISSTAAYQAVPTLSVYAASKAFVLLFSRGLKYELKNTNVSVTCLSPGPTSTDFSNRAGMNSKIKERADKFNMDPDKVAEFALSGMYSKKAEIIPGLMNKVGARITNVAPKWLTEKFAAGLYE